MYSIKVNLTQLLLPGTHTHARASDCSTWTTGDVNKCNASDWMDQDATWGTTRPLFSAHVYCGKTVAHLNYSWALVQI